MLGAIVGDIVGSCYEWHNIKTTDFPLFSERSRFTDDTVMSVAVWIGLSAGHGDPESSRELLMDAMHIYGRLYPRVGYGGRFAHWLLHGLREPYNSFGNGSAMRVSSAGWLYDSLEDVETYAEISAEVTHNHPEGIKGAQSVAGAIFLARSGATKEEIAAYATSRHGYDLSSSLDDIRPLYRFDVTCQGSVPQALRAFLESETFEDAVRKAVSIGGDSDTIAAIAGSVAEAFYGGVPESVAQEALARLDDRLRAEVRAFQQRTATKRSVSTFS
ncbi:MAG: ADP-ribosylglycohydrolase family protein [Desulfovibrio sp.]|nr:ADP-ribosylglycohydrolase family protein [Desulfovibrio sp.]